MMPDSYHGLAGLDWLTGLKQTSTSIYKLLRDLFIAYMRMQKRLPQICTFVRYLPSISQDKAFSWSVRRIKIPKLSIALLDARCEKNVDIKKKGFSTIAADNYPVANSLILCASDNEEER